MRYRDLKSDAFYVNDDAAHSGEVAAGQIDARLCSSQIEAHLEQHRPAECCPRAKSLLLYERPVGDRTYCYKVTPLDSVDRNHTGWLKILADVDPNQKGVIAHNVGLFWKGIECKEHSGEPWEVRTSAVKVISRVGGSSRATLTWKKPST